VAVKGGSRGTQGKDEQWCGKGVKTTLHALATPMIKIVVVVLEGGVDGPTGVPAGKRI